MTARKKASPSKAKTNPPPAVKGRPSVYTPSWHIPQAELLCRLGATLQQIAEAFQIDFATLKRWMVKHEALCATIKIGAAPADDAVEMTLYRRALGYQVTETERRYEMTEVEDPVTGENRVIRKLVEVKEKIKEVPPDTTAALFWLKNRRPAEWRESYQHTVTDPDDISPEHLARQLMFTFRQYAEEGGDLLKLLEEKTRPERDE